MRRYPNKHIILVSPDNTVTHLVEALQQFEDVQIIPVAFRWPTTEKVRGRASHICTLPYPRPINAGMCPRGLYGQLCAVLMVLRECAY